MTPNGDGHYKTDEELRLLSPDEFVDVLHAFGADHTLFGTDCPWGDQRAELARVRALPLADEEKQAIFCDNAARLLFS